MPTNQSDMDLKVKVSFKQYARLLFSITYAKPIMLLLIALVVLLVLWITFYYLHIFNLPEPVIYQYIPILLIVIVQPLVIFFTIRKNYYSSNHLRETLEIQLAETQIKIRGESFYMEILWSKIYKLVEKRNWFLVYENNLSAIIIPKKELEKDEIAKIREALTIIERSKESDS